MNLLTIWVSYTILVSVIQELNLLDYLLFNLLTLWFTYFFNLIRPLQISLSIVTLLWSLPNFIIFYVVFIYGSFLQISS